jgi:hypothetical protein
MPYTKKILKILDRDIALKNINAFRYQMAEAAYRLIRPSIPDPIFILGCSRSGTTVTFGTIRQSNQLISFPYEIPQFWHSLCGPWDKQWASECATANDANPAHRDKAFAHFYARLGKGQILDKSCINILRIPYLHALFPNARFVYIYRDGRDNVSSLMDGWRYDGHFNLKPLLGKIPETIAINEGEFSDWSFFLPPNWRDYNNASLEEVCAHQWNTANALALEAKPLIAEDKWIEVRYEDLVESPVELFENVFSKLNLDFDDTIKAHCAVLNKRPTSIVAGPPKKEKWRINNPDAITKILPKIEPLMTRLGYR